MARKEGNILDRIGDIMSSNVHALLDKCEDPEKMLDQNMRDAVEDLAELKESAKQLKADLTGAQRNYDGAMARMQAEHQYAVNAMKSGDEGTAAQFLASEKHIREQEVDLAKRNLDAAKKNFETVQKAYNKLAGDIELMKNERNHIKSTIRTAKATEKVAKMKDPSSGYSERFSKYAEKAQRMLDEANAGIELDEASGDGLDVMRAKYASSAAGPDMSDALAALRAECGMGEG